MDNIIIGFAIGAITTAAAFGAGLGIFLTTKTLSALANKLTDEMAKRASEPPVASNEA
jgi:hypothetical protein